MIDWWWSWLLAAVGILGLWIAGSGHREGWMIGMGAQLLWISYALFTEQYGFIPAALCYGAVYLRNWVRS